MSSIYEGVAPASLAGSGGAANEGVDFVAAHTGTIDAVQWYMAPVGGPASITAVLYDTQTQAVISSATVAGASLVAGAWNPIALPAPVAITPGHLYTASCFITAGSNGFTGGLLSNHKWNAAGDLTGLLRTGRFDNGAVAAFPTSKFPDAFGVDVSFTQTPTCPECPPCPPTEGFLINLTSPGFLNVITGVGSCVIGALDQTPAGAPCRQCTLVPTSQFAWDNCCESCDVPGTVQLAIRGVYGSEAFPQPFTGTWGKPRCGPRYQVVRAAVSVTRCLPALDQSGNAPSCTDELTAAVTLENDRTAIRQGIACCLSYAQSQTPALVSAWSMGETTTLPESGGCGGIEMEFLVAVQACVCPG